MVTEPNVLDAMLTTRPHLRARMPGTKAAVTRKVPSRLMESTFRQSAKLMVAKSCCGKMPAQFTTISTRPNLACTCLLIAATESSFDTSHTTASACRPAASTSLTVSRSVGEIGDGDMRAVLGETFGKSLADAVGAAGDDGDFVLMPFAHETSP